MTKTKIDYQSALEEVEQIVQDIESGSLNVDELAAKVKRATTLIKSCQTKLRDTEKTLDDILGELDS